MKVDPQKSIEQARQHFDNGNYAEAEMHALNVPTNSEFYIEACKYAAFSMGRLGRAAEQLKMFEYLAVVAPGDADVFFNLGAVLIMDFDDRKKAMIAYQACLRLNPDHIPAMWNYADLLRVEEHFFMAIRLFKKLEKVVDGSAKGDLYHRYAIALNLLCLSSSKPRKDYSLELFEKAIALGSLDTNLTYWEYAHAALNRGNYKKGWEAYEYRFVANTSVECHPYSYPWWQGENLSGKTLFIHGEQGLGDEVMFGQIIPELLKEGANIIWACQPPLVTLFSQSHPEITVYPHKVGVFGADVSRHTIDFQVAVCSLGRWRRTSADDFKNPPKSLSADAEKIEWFKERLNIKAPSSVDKLKIGLVWGANPSQGLDWGERRSMQKSIPLPFLNSLSQFCDSVQFVSLQNHIVADEAATAPELDVVDFSADLLDFSDTAALIESMDLVISVDTSVLHVCGALGKVSWGMLMKRSDWRWLTEGDSSHWYQNMRLFRQSEQGDWGDVINQVVRALSYWIDEQQKNKSNEETGASTRSDV